MAECKYCVDKDLEVRVPLEVIIYKIFHVQQNTNMMKKLPQDKAHLPILRHPSDDHGKRR